MVSLRENGGGTAQTPTSEQDNPAAPELASSANDQDADLDADLDAAPRDALESVVQDLRVALKGKWDPIAFRRLARALFLLGEYDQLIMEFEELEPGRIGRGQRWYGLALGHAEKGQLAAALGLLTKALHPLESPDHLEALLLSARVCSQSVETAGEGAGYARRACQVAEAEAAAPPLRGRALHALGVNLGMLARGARDQSERSRLQREAVEVLQEAEGLPGGGWRLAFDLALELAELCQLSAAAAWAREALVAAGEGEGRAAQGADTWRLLALLMSAEGKYAEAAEICAAGLSALPAAARQPLQRTKVRVQLAAGQPLAALETCQVALSDSLGRQRSNSGAAKAALWEQQHVWEDLAEVYVQLQRWQDAEACVAKAQGIGPYSPTAWHVAGLVAAARGDRDGARAAYDNALAADPGHRPSKVRLGELYLGMGSYSWPLAQAALADALQSGPLDPSAWSILGRVYEAEGRAGEAEECMAAAAKLGTCAPVEPFESIPWAL